MSNKTIAQIVDEGFAPLYAKLNISTEPTPISYAEADIINLWQTIKRLQGQAIEAHNRDLLQEVYNTMGEMLNEPRNIHKA